MPEISNAKAVEDAKFRTGVCDSACSQRPPRLRTRVMSHFGYEKGYLLPSFVFVKKSLTYRQYLLNVLIMMDLGIFRKQADSFYKKNQESDKDAETEDDNKKIGFIPSLWQHLVNLIILYHVFGSASEKPEDRHDSERCYDTDKNKCSAAGGICIFAGFHTPSFLLQYN